MVKILGDKYSFFKGYKVISDYHTYKVTKETDSLILHYFVDDSSSTWINDPEIFQKFSKKYSIVSGGWYGKHGRWKTLKRIFRDIKCTGIKAYEETERTDRGKMHIEKSIFSNKIKVYVESDYLPTMRFTCSDFSFTDYYKLMLLENEQGKYVDCTDLFTDGFTFTGKL